MSRKSILPILTLVALYVAWPSQRCAADSLDDDLAKVQGVWERRTGHDIPGLVRATKEIRGSHEVVTYYGKDDKVLQAHEVDIEVKRLGPVKLFTFSNWASTEGPNKGHQSPNPVTYIYRADANTFTEVWGFTAGQETRPPMVLMWVRHVALSGAEKKQLDALRGSWEVVKQDKGSANATDIPGDQVTIDGDDFVSRHEGHALLRGVIRLDPSEQPKRMNIIITESPNGLSNGQIIQAVYEIDGNELKWCSGAPAAPRPQTLSATPGSAQTLTVLRRAEGK